MNARSNLSTWVSLGALVVASTAAVAAEPETAAERSRAEVVSETVAARAAGTLAPAGEASTPRETAAAARSTLTRSAVESQVLEARASGTLTPAGEGFDAGFGRAREVTILTRAEVKADVIAARRAGDLIPAGEGPDAETHAHARSVATVRSAGNEGTTMNVAKR
jgi:hypothetical protein